MNAIIIALLLGLAYGRSTYKMIPRVSYETINLFGSNEIMEMESEDYPSTDLSKSEYGMSSESTTSRDQQNSVPNNFNGYNSDKSKSTITNINQKGSGYSNSRSQASVNHFKPRIHYVDQEYYSNIHSTDSNEVDLQDNDLEEYMLGQHQVRSHYTKFDNKPLFQNTIKKNSDSTYSHESPDNIANAPAAHRKKNYSKGKSNKNQKMISNKNDNAYGYDSRRNIAFAPVVHQEKNYNRKVFYEPVYPSRAFRYRYYVPTVYPKYGSQNSYYQQF